MRILGFIFIALGVVGSIVAFKMIDFREYKISKSVADKLYDNEFAQQALFVQKELLNAQITQAITILLVCVTIGILLLAINKIINILQETNEYSETTRLEVERIRRLTEGLKNG